MLFLTGPVRMGYCGLSDKNARDVINCTGSTLSNIEDFFVAFGADEMEKVLTKGGVSLMFTTQIIHAIRGHIEKKKESSLLEEKSSATAKSDTDNDDDDDDDDDDDAVLPPPPPLNMTQSIAAVIDTGVLVPEVTPRGRNRSRNFSDSSSSSNIQDNMEYFVESINADLAGYIAAPDLIESKKRGTRRMTKLELSMFIQAMNSTDNGEDINERVIRVVQRLFVACDRFALSGEFFNPNALVAILRFSEYNPNKNCVQHFWNTIAIKQLLGSNRAGDASWAFKLCIQHIIYSNIAQSFKQRMITLKNMIQNGKKQLNALKEWKRVQRVMGNLPHQNRNDDEMDVDDLEMESDVIVFYAQNFAYNFCKDLRLFLDRVLDTALDRALRIQSPSRMFDSTKSHGQKGTKMYQDAIAHESLDV